MFQKNRSGWQAFLVTIFCFLLAYFVFGFYYVEYEALANSFLSGKITPGVPFRAIYFLMHHGTSHLYSRLYEHFPNVEWLSWILSFYFFCATFLGMYIVGKLVPKDRPWWESIAWQILVYFLVYADHNIHFIFTRISYITVGTAFVGLIYFFGSVADIKKRPLLFLGINVLFTLGALCRIESSAALALLVFAFSCLYLKSIKQSIILFLYPVLFLSTFILYLSYRVKSSDAFYARVEPEIEAQFVERQNKIPLGDMTNAKDSVKYKMAAEIAWIDPNVITPEFMRSMIREEGVMFTDARQWRRVLGDIVLVTGNNWATTLFTIVFALSVALGQDSKSRFRWILYLLFFWFYLFIQAYTFKINDRSFLPNTSMFIFSLLLVALSVIYSKYRAGWNYAIVGSILIFTLLQLNYLRNEVNILRSDLATYQYNTQKIEETAKGKYLVVNSSSFDYVFSSHRPFHPFDYSSFKRIYITDGHVIPYIPYYKDYLEGECKCSVYNFPSFWTYLKSIRKDVIIMSTPQRMEVLQEYLKVMYGYQLNIEVIKAMPLLKVRKSDYRDMFWDLKMYELKADTVATY